MRKTIHLNIIQRTAYRYTSMMRIRFCAHQGNFIRFTFSGVVRVGNIFAIINRIDPADSQFVLTLVFLFTVAILFGVLFNFGSAAFEVVN